MKTHVALVAGLILASCVSAGRAQKGGVVAPPAAILRTDGALEVAESFIGRALFLRCFCAEDKLEFDQQGKPVGAVKVEDWTLAAVNVEKVERLAPGSIGLQGVRVAVRYAADRHEFERHPQKDERVRITVADTGDAQQMERTLAAVFAIGIDRPLQLAMPDYWKHYFDPKLEWGADALAGQTVYALYSGGAAGDVTAPKVVHRVDASYTAVAQRDSIRGSVQVRLVVDAQGVPRRIAVAQPLGYGLDEKAVEAVARFRFTPAMKAGVPVAASVLLDQEFAVVAVAR